MSRGSSAALISVVSYLPEGKLTNEELASETETWTPEKIEQKTGIRSRNVAAADEFSSDLGIKAARRLFESSDVQPQDVDFLLFITVTPDQVLPFTASTIQAAIGLPTTAGAMDISLACSGYPYALTLAGALIEAGRARRVLVLTADRFTAYADEAEMGSRTLFGDAGTASLVVAAEEGQPGGHIGLTRYGTDGTGAKHLIVPTAGVRGFLGDRTTTASKPTFEMNGPEVFDFTLRVVSKFLVEFLKEAELTVADVDHFVFHQANQFMLEHLRRRLKIPKENFVLHIAEVGNTSSSTIPIALAHMQQEGRLEPGQTAVLLGFGTGYSWSAARIDFS